MASISWGSCLLRRLAAAAAKVIDDEIEAVAGSVVEGCVGLRRGISVQMLPALVVAVVEKGRRSIWTVSDGAGRVGGCLGGRQVSRTLESSAARGNDRRRPLRAPHQRQFRAVASIAFNPFPASTFSGALFYSSVTPGLTAGTCRFQTSAHAPRTVETVQIDGIPFDHGYDERGNICTESRDETYTTFHNGACYRFDLVINNFCGGEVSDVKDMTPHEIDAIRKRLESILNTVQFDSK